MYKSNIILINIYTLSLSLAFSNSLKNPNRYMNENLKKIQQKRQLQELVRQLFIKERNSPVIIYL